MDWVHLWEALRYTELNPVRAGLASEAEAWMRLEGDRRKVPQGAVVAIFKWLLLDIECEFALSCVSGRFSRMSSFLQCQPSPCLLLEFLNEFCRSQRSSGICATTDCEQV